MQYRDGAIFFTIEKDPLFLRCPFAILEEIKLFNEKLSNFRCDLHHHATEEGKKMIKALGWLLLKNPDNHKPQYNEK